jgi:hypothetical protein
MAIADFGMPIQQSSQGLRSSASENCVAPASSFFVSVVLFSIHPFLNSESR